MATRCRVRCRVCLTDVMYMDDIETRGKRPLLVCSRNAEDWYKLLKLSKTCHHTQVHSYVPFCGCAQSKEAIQDHWLIDYSTVPAFGAYAIETKMQAVQVGTREQSIRRARDKERVWILLYSLHHIIRAIVQTEHSHISYQRNYRYIVSLVTYPRINLYDIIIWSYP